MSQNAIPDSSEMARGSTPSQWVGLARREEDLRKLSNQIQWMPVDDKKTKAWTDDFSNIVSVMSWK